MFYGRLAEGVIGIQIACEVGKGDKDAKTDNAQAEQTSHLI